MALDTRDEQAAFFLGHADALKAAAERGGASDAIDFIRGFEGRERIVLFAMSRQVLAMGEWEGKSLDAAVEVGRAGIEEMLAAAQSSDDGDERAELLQAANSTAYNLAADLADCWPEDDAPRERRHFEAGLWAAEQSLQLRRELGRGDLPMAIAHWVKGMHELSLGRAEDACTDWQAALDRATAAAGESLDDFQVLLNAGYLGLGTIAAGREGGEATLERALDGFRRRLEANAEDGEAQLGIDQLETVRRRYQLG